MGGVGSTSDEPAAASQGRGRGRRFQIQKEKKGKDQRFVGKMQLPKKKTKLEHQQKTKKGRKKDTHFPCIGSQIHATG